MNLNAINTILTAFIITMCVVFSYFLLFTDLMIETLYGTKRTIFVSVLLAYGAFRAYRLVAGLKNQKTKNQE